MGIIFAKTQIHKKILKKCIYIKATRIPGTSPGQTEEEIEPLVKKLQGHNVKTIFDFAVEADLEDTEKVDYHKIVQGFVSSIQTSSKLEERRFSQLKMSGLGDTKQIYNFSKFLRKVEDHMEEIHLEPQVASTIEINLANGQAKGSLTPLQTLKALQVDELKALVEKQPELQQFYNNDFNFEEINIVLDRLRQIATEAQNRNVKILVDAEQQYFQPALDFLAIKLQMEFNKEEAVIFNTQQCYLIETPQKIDDEIQISKLFNYAMGTKLVRGAYMIHEKRQAKDDGYDSPVWPTIQKTHDTYNRSAKKLIELGQNHKREVMIASHNQESIESALNLMRKLNIEPHQSDIYFAQLYGMSDYLTYPLASLGCQVYKAVPYGKIDLLLPYLVRRAQENSTILSGSSKEIGLMRKELLRRAFAG